MITLVNVVIYTHVVKQLPVYCSNEIASESYDEATHKYTSVTALQKTFFSEIAPRYAERNGWIHSYP